MRAIWKGSIGFGLVNIPIALHAATKTEELKFRLLRRADLSPVSYKRVSSIDGKEVPWAEIVKGYEYEKDKFVVLKEEDFKRVDLEATDTLDIIDFVDLAEVNPIYFYRPYYLEPLRGGAGAYALLRDVLARTNRAGIAKVVIKTRQHLGGIKANGNLLVLELMRFTHELIPPTSIKLAGQKKAGPRELKMAETLVDQMTDTWNPTKYKDDYTSALMKLIDRKVKSGGKALPQGSRPEKPATNVIDLASILQQSLAEAGGKPPRPAKKKSTKKTSAKRAA